LSNGHIVGVAACYALDIPFQDLSEKAHSVMINDSCS